MVEAIDGLQPTGVGRGARRVASSGTDAVLGAAEMDTGARGEQSEALDEAGEGLGAAEGDKASGEKRKRGKRATWGKRQAMAKQRATDERREQAISKTHCTTINTGHDVS